MIPAVIFFPKDLCKTFPRERNLLIASSVYNYFFPHFIQLKFLASNQMCFKTFLGLDH